MNNAAKSDNESGREKTISTQKYSRTNKTIIDSFKANMWLCSFLEQICFVVKDSEDNRNNKTGAVGMKQCDAECWRENKF